MKHIFKVVSGPVSGKSFELAGNQSLTIGRGQASDTQLDDPHMSRVHCRVTENNGKVTLQDLGSSSGTYVDGQAVKEITLASSNLIRVGGSEIQFQSSNVSEEQTIKTAPAVAKDLNPPKMHELIGKQLGQFVLDRIISHSAASMVFQGRDLEKERPVAVKVLTPDLANSEEQRERFVRAMKTMLPIRDKHLVRLYGAGKSGPFCWAAMEFIDGESLTQVIERIGIEGMLDWKQVWRVAMDIGMALAVAEQNKIIHRNVTPTNIMRRSDDKSCVLGDLMLAKALDGTLAVAVTRQGQLIGDIAYMSPERTRGDVNSIDARSDLYGLGASLYALLTGRPPFQSDSLSELITQIRSNDPKPPKSYQLSINDLFEAIVLKLLAKSPDNRYQSASELLKELERIGRYNNLVYTAG